jgi:hypothetical protein
MPALLILCFLCDVSAARLKPFPGICSQVLHVRATEHFLSEHKASVTGVLCGVSLSLLILLHCSVNLQSETFSLLITEESTCIVDGNERPSAIPVFSQANTNTDLREIKNVRLYW